MKVDRRKLKRPKKPYCIGKDHKYGDFIPHDSHRLIKRCANCPAVLTRAEWEKSDMKIIVTPTIVRRKTTLDTKEHISLFY